MLCVENMYVEVNVCNSVILQSHLTYTEQKQVTETPLIYYKTLNHQHNSEVILKCKKKWHNVALMGISHDYLSKRHVEFYNNGNVLSSDVD